MALDADPISSRSDDPTPLTRSSGVSSLRRVVTSDVLYRQISSGVPGWITTMEGTRWPLHIERWLGGANSTTEDRVADDALLGLCTGPTVDVGCGPGRFTAALVDRGVPSLGVDVSATAVEMTVRRGGTALHWNVFNPIPGHGRWSHVLLADGNIGIGGNPLRMLTRARQLLHPQGTVVAEVEAQPAGVQREHRRWETDDAVSRWFPWARVGSDAVSTLAESAGFLVVHAVEVSGRCVVALRMA